MSGTSAFADPLNIAFTVHSNSSNTFWQAVQKGYEDACTKLTASCQMVYVQTDGSVQEQVANMEAAIARKPDALITSIVDNKAFDDVIKRARDAGIIVIASNVDDLEGAKGNARQAFVGQGFIPAGYTLGKAMNAMLPKEGPLKIAVGISAPGQNWSEQRGKGVMNFFEELKASGRDVTITRLDTGTDLAVVADRVGAYLNANPDTNAYFDTGYWHAAVAKVLADRGVPPGKTMLGGFDLVPEVLQQMKTGYVQVQIDQQPYKQGFLPVVQAYLAKNFGLDPSDVDTGQGVVLQANVDKIMELSKQGVR